MNKTEWRFHIGQQNIKSALAAAMCALIYLLINRNPTFACIGAIFGVGGDIAGSKLYGGNRFFGTIIGGVLGMILFRLYLFIYPDGQTRALMLLFVFIGVVLLILAGNLCKWAGAIQPGGVVLCIILFNTPADAYISYSLNRIIDTGIGVAVGILISLLLPRHRMHKIMEFLHLRKHNNEFNVNIPTE